MWGTQYLGGSPCTSLRHLKEIIVDQPVDCLRFPMSGFAQQKQNKSVRMPSYPEAGLDIWTDDVCSPSNG